MHRAVGLLVKKLWKIFGLPVLNCCQERIGVKPVRGSVPCSPIRYQPLLVASAVKEQICLCRQPKVRTPGRLLKILLVLRRQTGVGLNV